MATQKTITQKKVKVVGSVERINPQTGEFETYELTQYQERDFNFAKVWMKSFIQSLDIVGNKKTKFAYWLIDQISRENIIPFTYRQMAEASGISLGTVRDTMHLLLDADFVRQKNQGCYIINPNIVFKGTHKNRLNILNQYNTADRVELSKTEKLINIQKAIAELQKTANALIEDIQSEAVANGITN